MRNKIKTKNEFQYYVTHFFTLYLTKQKNLSTNTIKSYRDTFRIMLNFFSKEKNINISKISFSEFSKENIICFLDYLEDIKENSILTRNQRLAAIHSFCKFVQAEEPDYLHHLQEILKIPLKKGTKKVIGYLVPDAIEILLKQPNLNQKNGLRDLLILSLLYDTGARVQELIDIKIKDIRLDKPSIIKLYGKGDKIREVPIMSNTKKILKEYITISNKNVNQYLFESSSNRKFSRKGICYIIDKYVEKARKVSNIIPPKVNPHMFRHTKAMHLLQSGVNLIYIRDFLGHVDIQTTEIYAKYDTETKRKAIESVYPELINTNLPDWNSDDNLMQFLNSL